MEDSCFVTLKGKTMRRGYTTGSCAAAASKAAAIMLMESKLINNIQIETPKGIKLNLEVCEPHLDGNTACCYIIKDAGDDPDVTNGVRVYSKVSLRNEGIMRIIGGKGIGKVTKKGLPIPPGEPAINPEPRKMIMKEVRNVLSEGLGADIEISIPEGEEISKKTYNPKLGIEGGLSVLGTSGIVEPMSEEAIRATIQLELKQKRISGIETIVLVPGNYGQKFCMEYLDIKPDYIVKISNYLGFSLDVCRILGFKGFILAGHIGKLIKASAGIFHLHSRVSDTRMEILTAYLAILGMDRENLIRIMECTTTEEAMEIIDNLGYSHVYQEIADRCSKRCNDYVFNELIGAVVIFSMKEMLAKSCETNVLLQEVKK